GAGREARGRSAQVTTASERGGGGPVPRHRRALASQSDEKGPSASLPRSRRPAAYAAYASAVASLGASHLDPSRRSAVSPARLGTERPRRMRHTPWRASVGTAQLNRTLRCDLAAFARDLA